MIPDWKLERYIQGCLPESDMMQIRFEESQDEVLRARIASLKKSDEEILSQYPSEKMIPELIMKANKKNKNKILFYFPMVAAAVLLVVFVPFYSPDIAFFGNRLQLQKFKSILKMEQELKASRLI